MAAALHYDASFQIAGDGLCALGTEENVGNSVRDLDDRVDQSSAEALWPMALDVDLVCAFDVVNDVVIEVSNGTVEPVWPRQS